MVKTPIYFDHAATTPVDPKVLEKMRQGGIIDLIGEEYVFQTAQQAILIAQKEHM